MVSCLGNGLLLLDFDVKMQFASGGYSFVDVIYYPTLHGKGLSLVSSVEVRAHSQIFILLSLPKSWKSSKRQLFYALLWGNDIFYTRSLWTELQNTAWLYAPLRFRFRPLDLFVTREHFRLKRMGLALKNKKKYRLFGTIIPPVANMSLNRQKIVLKRREIFNYRS